MVVFKNEDNIVFESRIVIIEYTKTKLFKVINKILKSLKVITLA